MSKEKICAVVAGGLGTDLFGLELENLVGKGELGFGGRLHIGAGGKSRNIAQMMAALMGKQRVAMVGRTARDPHHLWRVPVKALRKAGVNTDYVKVLSFEQSGKFPQIALIAVDKHGSNQIYVMPGVNEDFCAQDVADAQPVFEQAAKNAGVLAISFEMPMATAIAAVKQANACGLKALVDPGGIRPELDWRPLLELPIFLLKPNEHEMHMMSGKRVHGEAQALIAARSLLNTTRVENVLITLGANGACLINKKSATFIPIPTLANVGSQRDETGCGDQTMAALCASLLAGKSLEHASHDAVLAGTMQFFRSGIAPVTKAEFNRAQKTQKESKS